MSDEMCLDGFHSTECPGCGMTAEERDGQRPIAIVKINGNATAKQVAALREQLAALAQQGVTLTREPEPLMDAHAFCAGCGAEIDVHTDCPEEDNTVLVEGVMPTREPGLLGECGFNEPHEPHEYVVAQNGKPVVLPCPGLTREPGLREAAQAYAAHVQAMACDHYVGKPVRRSPHAGTHTGCPEALALRAALASEDRP